MLKLQELIQAELVRLNVATTKSQEGLDCAFVSSNNKAHLVDSEGGWCDATLLLEKLTHLVGGEDTYEQVWHAANESEVDPAEEESLLMEEIEFEQQMDRQWELDHGPQAGKALAEYQTNGNRPGDEYEVFESSLYVFPDNSVVVDIADHNGIKSEPPEYIVTSLDELQNVDVNFEWVDAMRDWWCNKNKDLMPEELIDHCRAFPLDIWDCIHLILDKDGTLKGWCEDTNDNFIPANWDRKKKKVVPMVDEEGYALTEWDMNFVIAAPRNETE